MKEKFGKFIRVGIIVLILLGLVIQLIPYGKDHTNPSVRSEPNWNSPETRALAQRACFDCHSNETVWPWYSNIAPVSWLVQSDVENGRRHLNFSEWQQGGQGEGIGEAIEVLQEGEMPPLFYIIPHPEARLTVAEKQALIDGLRQSK